MKAPMQGTAADIIKMAMISVQSWLDREALASRMVLQIHDELVLEVPIGEKQVVLSTLPSLLGSVAQLSAPLVAKMNAGLSWGHAY